MEALVTAREMQEYDRYAIETLKIPGVVLMENAGSEAVAVIREHFGDLAGRSFCIVCGKGNNGGDGSVVARHLLNLGARVLVILLGEKKALKGDARTNFELLRNIKKKLLRDDSLQITEVRSVRVMNVLPPSEFIIDAIFGTGISGGVRGLPMAAIEWINSRSGIKISLDIPSGVNADNGDVVNVAVKADITITMGLKKIGLITGRGRGYAGRIKAVNIGIPQPVFNHSRDQTFLLEAADIGKVMPIRPFNAHKHSVGKILVLAGSRGLTGAAAMASAAAMRAGAGAVVLGTPESVYPVLARKLTEVMVEPLPETPEGSLGLAAYEPLQKHLRWADVLILGPGLSRVGETEQFIRKVVRDCKKPLLLDADGLNALAENTSILHRKGHQVIITPHTGELSRLTGIPSEEIERNRVSIARKVARDLGITLVLKGAPTVTATEKGEVFVNPTGNPGMATAGSGDVLSGIIGALWAQGMSRSAAAFSGVFVHGRAGDMARSQFGEKALMAMDIHRKLPEALLEVEGCSPE